MHHMSPRKAANTRRDRPAKKRDRKQATPSEIANAQTATGVQPPVEPEKVNALDTDELKEFNPGRPDPIDE
jgi:hypothetical protein